MRPQECSMPRTCLREKGPWPNPQNHTDDFPAPAGGESSVRGESQDHPARILVSSTRKPMSYINLAKRFLNEHGEVHFAALGVAISPMVTAAEILKNRRLANVSRITTSLETLPDDQRERQKPKMEVIMHKSPDFDEAVAQESAVKQGGRGSGLHRVAALTFKISVICTCKLPSKDRSSGHPASSTGKTDAEMLFFAAPQHELNIVAGGSAMITKAKRACA